MLAKDHASEFTEEDLSSQLTTALSSLSIAEDDTITSYLEGLLKEEDIDDEEKREAITEFLSEIIPHDDSSLAETIDKWINNWNTFMKQKQKQEEERVRQKFLELQRKESEILQKDIGKEDSAQDHEAMKKKALSDEEKRRREVLMQKFGYEEEAEDNANNLGGENTNALKVKQQEDKRRDEMKKKSEIEKQRIKEQQERELKAREAERKRTQKQEKRRM